MEYITENSAGVPQVADAFRIVDSHLLGLRDTAHIMLLLDVSIAFVQVSKLINSNYATKDTESCTILTAGLNEQGELLESLTVVEGQ